MGRNRREKDREEEKENKNRKRGGKKKNDSEVRERKILNWEMDSEKEEKNSEYRRKERPLFSCHLRRARITENLLFPGFLWGREV